MEYIVISNQKSVVEQILKLDKKLNSNNRFREDMSAKYLPNQKYSTNQNYKIISKILEEEVKVRGYGSITVWRVLKIYEKDKNAYKRILEGEAIRTVYNEMIGKVDKKREIVEPVKPAEPVIKTFVLSEELSFESCVEILTRMKDFLDGLPAEEEIEEDMEKVRQKLFFCSMAIKKKSSEIAKNRKWEQEF